MRGRPTTSLPPANDTLTPPTRYVVSTEDPTGIDTPITCAIEGNPARVFPIAEPQGVLFAIGLDCDDNCTANVPSDCMFELPAAFCDSPDFNNNDVFPEDQDILDFYFVLSGGDCPTCGDVDFNNNGVFPETADITAFFNVLAGGPCLLP